MNAHELQGLGAVVVWRKAKGAVLAFVMLLSLGALVPPAHAQPMKPEDVVRQFYSVLQQTMQNGPTLGPRGRYRQLEPEIRNDFDLSAMTRLAVGVAWNGLSEEDRQRVSDAFARYITATYAQNFDSWSGETLAVTGTRDSGYGTIVETRIDRPNDKPVAIDYLMRVSNGAWQIADVYLTGTISQVASLRSQFGAILSRQGVGGLIASLNSKADTLVASAAPR